ncbi:MAG: hypothetical protein IIV99_05005, partial [Oscillospiraceae bacterium]|nr:hypothetical protein [Oscillospiraceae bacterium]
QYAQADSFNCYGVAHVCDKKGNQYLIDLQGKEIPGTRQLDFGDYWVVFVTCEDGNESWRLFAPNKEIPHMVVSDSKIEFV